MSDVVATSPQGLAGKYKPYPEYKDSGVEWLGDIPTHWCTTVLKRLCCLTTGLTPPTSDEANYAEDGYPWVRPEDIDESGSETKASKFVSSDGWQLLRKIESNSTLICCIGTIGKCGYVRRTVSTNQQITAATFSKSRRYNYYLLQAARTQLEELATGNVLKILNTERLGALNLVKVPVEEADTIAAFLDYETARIDRLIAQQQWLIELLKEKRQAVISHAVTKGLNPDAPMKNSGVEWLGQVPEHWRVMALRHLLDAIEQGKSPECDARTADVNEWGVLKTGCVNGGKYNPDEHKALPSHIPPHADYEVCPGDVLMSRASGSRHLIGAVAYVDATREKLLLSDKVFRLILNRNVDPMYFTFLMSSTGLRAQVELAINGAEGLANNITKEAIRNFITALPDHKEQREIRAFIEQKQAKFSASEECLREGLGLLQERRTALISAAVTGKIDLRGWELPHA